jgi:hypothetical protein
MSDFIKWAFSIHAPTSAFVAAFVLARAALFAAVALTFAMIAYGFGWIALALWIGIPAWIAVSAYQNRGGGE